MFAGGVFFPGLVISIENRFLDRKVSSVTIHVSQFIYRQMNSIQLNANEEGIKPHRENNNLRLEMGRLVINTQGCKYSSPEDAHKKAKYITHDRIKNICKTRFQNVNANPKTDCKTKKSP